jgi:hypothetical protein
MSVSTLHIVFAIVLIAHGIGHALGLMAVFGIRLSKTHSPGSWLLTGLLGETVSRIIGFLIWTLALVGFLGAGMGLLGWLVPTDWWQPLAVGAAILSLMGLFLFWNGFPFFFPNKVGVFVVDVATILSPHWLGWPPDNLG